MERTLSVFYKRNVSCDVLNFLKILFKKYYVSVSVIWCKYRNETEF